jgi:hypothetical protein
MLLLIELFKTFLGYGALSLIQGRPSNRHQNIDFWLNFVYWSMTAASRLVLWNLRAETEAVPRYKSAGWALLIADGLVLAAGVVDTSTWRDALLGFCENIDHVRGICPAAVWCSPNSSRGLNVS